MNPLIHALCWTLIHSLWEGLVLALVAGTVMILSRKSSATQRYNLLCGLLLMFVIAIGYTFYQQLSSANALAEAERLNSGTALTTQGASTPEALANTGGTPTHPTVGAAQTLPAAGPEAASTPGSTTASGAYTWKPIQIFIDYFNAHASVVVLIWFIFFLGRFVQMLSALVKAQRIRHYGHQPAPMQWEHKLKTLMDRLNIQLPVRLLQSNQIKVPVVMGYLKPLILLPLGMINHLSEQEVESILLHELAHIRRRDYLINLIQGLLDTLFFFNPALLWVSSLIRHERENCCDDMAISQTGSRQQFVEALVSFYAYTNPAPDKYALAFAAKESQLVSRVKRIVYKKNRTLNPIERSVLLGVLLLMGVSFTVLAWTNGPAPESKTQGLSANGTMPADTTKPGATTAPSATTASNAAAEPGSTAQSSAEAQAGAQSGAEPDALPIAGGQPDARPGAQPNLHMDMHLHVHDTIPEDDKDTSSKSDDDPLVQTPARWTALGYADHIHLNFLLELSEHGLTPAYIEDLRHLGYSKISLEEALDLQDHGVNAANVKEYNDFTGKHLELDEVKSYIDHGVNIEYVKEMRQLAGKPITMEQAEEYRDHGVSKEFIKSFLPLGYNLSLDQAEELADHGVTAEYIKKVQAQGLKNLTLEKYERLRDAGF